MGWDGPGRPHAGDFVRQHRQLRLVVVWPAQQQVREGCHVHEGDVRHLLPRGGLRPQLLLRRSHDVRRSETEIAASYLPNNFSSVKKKITPPKKKKKKKKKS